MSIRTMTVTEWLRETISFTHYAEYDFQAVRPMAICGDGMAVSIQHSHTHYCIPRMDGSHNYLSAEVGYPSEEPPEHWVQWQDGDAEVWGYVPIEEIEEWVAGHGGITVRRREP